jgi:hypothetical protein
LSLSAKNNIIFPSTGSKSRTEAATARGFDLEDFVLENNEVKNKENRNNNNNTSKVKQLPVETITQTQKEIFIEKKQILEKLK